MHRSAVSFLAAQVFAPATIELQVAVAGATHNEDLSVTVDGRAIELVELATEGGGRLHRFVSPAGRLEVRYRCEVKGALRAAEMQPLDATTYLRPSRYAESDHLADTAATLFGGTVDPAELVRGVAAWVGRRLSYVGGSSIGTDGAVDTLRSGVGVCRDYAHLTVALLRARDVPARIVAVYAPGLWPMDFHAVAEALVDNRWCALDPTLLAPRQSMLRIATGRDAADTAFLSSYGAEVRLDRIEISAVVEGDLPTDDLDALVRLG